MPTSLSLWLPLDTQDDSVVTGTSWPACSPGEAKKEEDDLQFNSAFQVSRIRMLAASLWRKYTFQGLPWRSSD